MLKGFLRREAPSVDVKCLDINLDYYSRGLDLLEEGSFKLRLYNWGHEETAAKIRGAFNFLKTVHPGPSNIQEYHRQATFFLSFENIFNSFMSEMASRLLAGIHVPERINLFFEDLFNRVIRDRPDLVGISVLFDAQMPFALLLAKQSKEKTGSDVILGGARFGVTPYPGRILAEPVIIIHKEKRHVVLARDFVDGVVSGEGEMALLHMVNAHSKAEFVKAPDLSFWQKGEVVQNPARMIRDVNSLPPPDFSDLPLKDYLSAEVVLPFITSRGCPWGKCVFCTHHRSYKSYRQIAIERVVDQLEYLRDVNGASFFNFYDEMIPPTRFRNIALGIMKRGLDIRYSAYGKPVKSFNKTTLETIYASGCRVILWGVESASQRVLDLMRKGTKIVEVEKVLNDSAEAGIKNLIFIMFGFPGESEKEFYQTIEFLERNRTIIHALSKGKFILTEGSDIMKQPASFGLKEIREIAASPMQGKVFCYVPQKGLRQEQVESLYKKNLPRLELVGITPRFGIYREHLLVYACHKSRPCGCRVCRRYEAEGGKIYLGRQIRQPLNNLDIFAPEKGNGVPGNSHGFD